MEKKKAYIRIVSEIKQQSSLHISRFTFAAYNACKYESFGHIKL